MRFLAAINYEGGGGGGRIDDDSMIPHSLAISLAFSADLHLHTVLKGLDCKEGWLDPNFGRLQKAWRMALWKEQMEFFESIRKRVHMSTLFNDA